MSIRRVPHLVRFGLVGGLCAFLQLGVLDTLVRLGWNASAANLTALLALTQANFFLSRSVTWVERITFAEENVSLRGKMLRFNGMVAVSLLVNQLTFEIAATHTHYLPAAALGILVAGAINYIGSDKLVFVAVGQGANVASARRRRSDASAAEGLTDQATLFVRKVIDTMRYPLLDRRGPSVDVVIPVYNEARQLERSVTTLRHFLIGHASTWRWRIVIADNASVDQTLEIARMLAERWPGEVAVVHLDEKGRGRVLRRAWTESDAQILCYMDVDLSTELEYLPTLVDALIVGYDIAFGSRLAPGARVRRGLKREVISRCYNALIRLAFGNRFHDAQCGFKALTRQAADELLPLVKDQAWFFDTELLLIAEKNRYHLKEIPVSWHDDPDSRVRILKTAWEDLKGLWRLKRHFPRPGLALLQGFEPIGSQRQHGEGERDQDEDLLGRAHG